MWDIKGYEQARSYRNWPGYRSERDTSLPIARIKFTPKKSAISASLRVATPEKKKTSMILMSPSTDQGD